MIPSQNFNKAILKPLLLYKNIKSKKTNQKNYIPLPPCLLQQVIAHMNNCSLSSSPSLHPDVALSLTLPSSSLKVSPLEPEQRGIYLIQHLITCAKHTASGNLHHADSCLRQISQLASINGDSLQRLAARFASALALRLVKRWPGVYKALSCTRRPNNPEDRALRVFTKAFPYLGFAYSIIARTLLQAMSHEGVIHIVDLGSGDTKLWVPLIRSFALLPCGIIPHLRISCVHGDKAVLDKLGQRLVKEAEALDIAFQYNPINVANLKELDVDMFEQRSGEALGFVSVLNLHALLAEDDRVEAHFFGGKSKDAGIVIKESKQMEKFLATIRLMCPKVVLLVEQEADHNLNRLVDRLVGSLNYYSAVFDSLDVTFGSSSSLMEERLALEEMFGREIENIIACEGLERVERHEIYGRWLVRFGGAGFKPVRLWFNGLEDCQKMVEAYGKEGYKIISNKASLVICWHERPLYAVSAWTC